MNFLMNNALYLILLTVIVTIKYYRFYRNQKPNFKDFYNLQIIQYTATVLLINFFILDHSDLSAFIDQIANFSELATISGILAGFIFAGISILYSFMGNNVISEQFKYNFMDHIFAKLFLSILSSIFVIMFYALFLIFPNIIVMILVKLYIVIFFVSLFYFIWSIYEIYHFLRKLKSVI